MNGCIIQVDPASALQTLAKECSLDFSEDNVLKRLGITIDLGRVHNVNKNPIAENTIREFHKMRLRFNKEGGPVSETELAEIIIEMNRLPRNRGYAAKEIFHRRDKLTNAPINCDDLQLANTQQENRLKNHPHSENNKARGASPAKTEEVNKGDLV